MTTMMTRDDIVTEIEVIPLDSLSRDDEDGFHECEEGENFDALTGVFAFGATNRHVLATWLPVAFDKWGVKYRLVEGWATRGRPISVGYFDPNACLVHHTGSTSSATNPRPSLRTLIEGRTGLSGPLSQTATDFNGITDIIAAGRCNHAGQARAVMGNPAGDGNAMYLANEVQTNGTQKMPQAQYDAIVLVEAAKLDHFGYKDASKLGLHHTTSLSGKWDLGAGTGAFGVPFSITKLRADVTRRLKAGPPVGPTLNLGDRGEPISLLQGMLNRTGAKLVVDGSFGPATEAAVKVFQASKRLPATGVVDTATMAALKAALAAPSVPTTTGNGMVSMIFYRLQSENKADADPVIVSDGFQMRWVTDGTSWTRIRESIRQQTGTYPEAIGVQDLAGVALQWVGPLPHPAYPIPASVKVVS